MKAKILEQVEHSPVEQRRRAADLVHALATPPPRGAAVGDLMAVAGILDDESAHQMREAIEEGCEQVDLEER